LLLLKTIPSKDMVRIIISLISQVIAKTDGDGIILTIDSTSLFMNRRLSRDLRRRKWILLNRICSVHHIGLNDISELCKYYVVKFSSTSVEFAKR